MMAQQNFKDLNQELLDLQLKNETSKTARSKSFRSKMFQKNIVKPIPKISNKQIQLHNPRYQKYLLMDIDLRGNLKAPQIWGCIIPEPRKVQSPKRNYLKRNIDTPNHLFRTYLNRKNRLMFGVPIIKKVHSQEKSFQQEDINPQQQKDNVVNLEVSQFFTEIKQHYSMMGNYDEKIRLNQTAREKVQRYSDQGNQKFKSSRFFSTKPASSSCTSRFSQLLRKDQNNLASKQQKRNFDNKSLYQMSVDQLRESINWKKKFLKCLNQSIMDAKSVNLK